MNRAAMKDHGDHLIKNLNFITPEFIAANLSSAELQSTRSDPNSAEEFTEDKVAGTVSFGVAYRCMKYLLHDRSLVFSPNSQIESKPESRRFRSVNQLSTNHFHRH